MQQYVVVGNGVAGHRAAIELRRRAPEASIVLIGLDIDLPYDRPTLSKEFLLGTKSAEQIVLKDALLYDQHRIDYWPGTQVEEIDAANRQVTAAGCRFRYDALLLATGSRPRRLPGGLDAGRGLYLRSLEDARRLSAELRPGRRVAVIGGGFIGLELAAAARAHGCEVTVVEQQRVVLSRGLPPLASSFMQNLHLANNVDIRCGETVVAMDWTSYGSAAIQLTGSRLEADVVVYGLGIVPNVELAEKLGLPLSDGILVDDHCRTANPAIFAAGEVTSHPTGRFGRHRRIESWRLSSEQPVVAAANMAGGDEAYADPAWLWSDQYDVNLQCLGDVVDGSAYLLRGSLDDRKWTLIALDDDRRPIGAVAVNNGRDISMLRRTIAAGGELPAALAADARPFAEGAGVERLIASSR